MTLTNQQSSSARLNQMRNLPPFNKNSQQRRLATQSTTNSSATKSPKHSTGTTRTSISMSLLTVLAVIITIAVEFFGCCDSSTASFPVDRAFSGGDSLRDYYFNDQPQLKSPSSFSSVCYECSNLTSSPYVGSCCCTPLLDIRCRLLVRIPIFTRLDPHLVMSGAYMDNQVIAEILHGTFKNFKVQKLNLNSNPMNSALGDDSFKGLEKFLKELYLGDCDLTNLPSKLLHGLGELQHLHLWGNKFRSIPRGFFETNQKLEELLLWGNNLSRLENDTFSGLDKLRKLDLDKNQIRTIGRGFFTSLTSLAVLHLGENQIESIEPESFKFLENLRVLSLDGNKIVSLNGKTFIGLKSLVSLALNRNEIKTLPTDAFGMISNVTTLLLQDNKIQSFWPQPFQDLTALRKLDLSRNYIDKIDAGSFSGSKQLIYLYLDDNSIKHMGRCLFSTEVKIKVISLLGNKLQCDCRLMWIQELKSKNLSTQIWGVCQRSHTISGPVSISRQFVVVKQTCMNDASTCSPAPAAAGPITTASAPVVQPRRHGGRHPARKE